MMICRVMILNFSRDQNTVIYKKGTCALFSIFELAVFTVEKVLLLRALSPISLTPKSARVTSRSAGQPSARGWAPGCGDTPADATSWAYRCGSAFISTLINFAAPDSETKPLPAHVHAFPEDTRHMLRDPRCRFQPAFWKNKSQYRLSCSRLM